MTSSREHFDAVVIGAGFGGLGAALRLCEHGARVLVCETQNYPGGCASTFSHRDHRFESGATLFSGFGPGQLFRRWIDEYALDVTIDRLDPVVRISSPDLVLDVPSRRDDLVRRLCDLPGAPSRDIRRFFAKQKKVADLLWELLDDPDRLLPLGPGGLARHLRNLPRYASLLPLAGRPLASVIERYGLENFRPLRTFFDAICQITLQCDADHAEAPFALSTLDYFHRGTGHVRGGIDSLARALCGAVEASGGTVSFADSVKGLERSGSGWQVRTRKGVTRADHVIANVLPANLRRLLGDEAGPRTLDELSEDLKDGWGACMLYLAFDRAPDANDTRPHHFEIIQDPSLPFVEGNHVFCSVSGAADGRRTPDGGRTMTVSTHVAMRALRERPEPERGAWIAGIQRRMRSALERHLPEWMERLTFDTTASPRTFERFTGRDAGYVGGVPRTAGWHNYRHIGPRRVLDGLWLVGDTVFPGQSTLATALGGYKVADAVARTKSACRWSPRTSRRLVGFRTLATSRR